MSGSLMVFALLSLVWAAAVAITDYRSQRIPNKLLLLALLATLLCLGFEGKTPFGIGWFDAGCGLFAAFFLTLPGYLLDSRLCAGDVKLAAVLGLMLGLHGVLLTLLIAALLLGAASLLVLVHVGRENIAAVKLPAGVALCAGFALNLTAQHWLRWSP